jgi:hypothetical protein
MDDIVYHSLDGNITFERYVSRQTSKTGKKPDPKKVPSNVYSCYKINDSGDLGYNIVLCSGCSNYNSIIVKKKQQCESGIRNHCQLLWKKKSKSTSVASVPLEMDHIIISNDEPFSNDEPIMKKRQASLKQPPLEQVDQLINQPCFENDERKPPKKTLFKK